MNNPTCVIDGVTYEAVEFAPDSDGYVRACDNCVATPGAGMCYRLDDCQINGVYHYWVKVNMPNPTPRRCCGTCLTRGCCPGGADPWAETCVNYDPHPGINGCCAAILLMAGAIGAVVCFVVSILTPGG